MKTKVCTKCGLEKSLPDFRKRSNSNSYQSWCRKCESTYAQKEAPNSFWTRLKNNLKRKYQEDFDFTPTEMKEALGEPHRCYICGDLIQDRSDAELDHVVPLSKGGETCLENLRWTHKVCNRLKHDMLFDDMLDKMEKILAYHR